MQLGSSQTKTLQTGVADEENKTSKSNKSTARLENKKRKAIAHLNILEINEKDKKINQAEAVSSEFRIFSTFCLKFLH